MSSPSGRRGVKYSHDTETKRKIARTITRSICEGEARAREMRMLAYRSLVNSPQTPAVKEQVAELSKQLALDAVAAHAEDAWDVPAGSLRGEYGKTTKVGAGIQLTDAQRAQLDADAKAINPTAGSVVTGLPRTGNVRSHVTAFIADLRAAGQTDFATALENALAAMESERKAGVITTKSSRDDTHSQAGSAPVFDARFAVERQAAPVPTGEPETFHGEQEPDDGYVARGIRITEDGS
jgi:hypothetical protein